MNLYKGISVLLFLSIYLSFSTPRCFATHVMGSDLSYTCSNDTFTFILNVYRDCNGISQNPSQSLNFQSSTGCSVNFNRNLTYQGNVDVTPSCATIGTQCDSGTASLIYGIQKHTYTTSIVLNQWPSCCTWLISWSDCCRNSAIQTLSNPTGNGFYTEVTINRCLAASNNSPQFNDFPIYLICNNKDQSLNVGAIETLDLPRDSISYALVRAMQGSNSTATYSGQYGATRPINFLGFPNSSAPLPFGFHINSSTGTLEFRPTSSMTGVIAIEATEWRKINGSYQEIGKVRRDIQITVINCSNTQNTPSLPTIASQGFCAGVQTCFNIASSDLDAADSVDVFWDEGIDGATFTTDNATALKATGTFCWTPSNSHISDLPYYFSILARDNSCNINLLTTKTYEITVEASSSISPQGTQVVINGDSLLLTGTVSSGATSYQWYRDGVAIAGVDTTFYYAKTSGKFNMQATFPTCTTNSDTVEVIFYNSITSFPYYEGFESSTGDWTESGTNSSWEYGSPSKTYMARAANGTNCWATKLMGSYHENEVSYLYSPYFDFTSFAFDPTLSFSLFRRIEQDNDSLWVEYTENGSTWTKLGLFGDGVNWYNNANGNYWHNDDLSVWRMASIPIPVSGMTDKTEVRFRFVFKTNGSFNEEGVGIDDIHIHETNDIWAELTTSSGALTINSTGSNNWEHFTIKSDRLVSFNDNGQNLGIVTLTCYRDTSPQVRSINDSIDSTQYYLDRNWKITTQNAPTGNVSLRLYFTDEEYWALNQATGLINNPYQLGVTKYSGANEDSILTNNTSNGYSFITPSQVTGVIPYDDGYWIEFNTSSFSEFWINSGGVSQSVPLPVDWLHFSAIKKDRNVILNWSTAAELNNDYFEVEYANEKNMARGQFRSLGVIPGHHNSLRTHSYQMIDPNISQTGLRFYRLKQVDRNGAAAYYPKIQFVNFDEDLSGELLKMEVHPNPFENEVALTFTSHSDGQASLKLYDTRGVLLMEQGADVAAGYNEVDLQLPAGISKGLYVLHVSYGTHYSHHKIIRR